MGEDVAVDSEGVRFDITEGVATVSLVRETRMNAFDEAMHRQLRAALAAIASDAEVRVVIITGSGRAFSSGQDLGERAAAFERGEVPDLHASLGDNYNPLVLSLAELSIPVIAAVNGIAFGAGAAISIACDIVIAARSAKFQFGFVNVGLGPDSGASWNLPRLVGNARAMDLALTGRAVSAEEALTMGLISRVVDNEVLSDTALQVAQELTSKSPLALAAIKRQFRTNPSGTLSAALDTERDAQAELGASPQYREAVLRFARPRP